MVIAGFENRMHSLCTVRAFGRKINGVNVMVELYMFEHKIISFGKIISQKKHGRIA